jgi:glycosyltransferase involved in cell wall biosynthesis
MNLPDSRHFAPLPASRDKEGLEWIVYSGSVARRNGIDLAVLAVALLAEEFPALRFRVIGDGPALGPIVRLAEELGVADRVDFRGFIPHEQIPALLSNAAAGISTQRGGIFGSLVFSMKVAEYIALGLPVICSDIPTMRLYFSDDELLFFEPDNAEDLAQAMRALLTDPAAAAERAARSRRKLDELGWPAQKEMLVQTVEALAGSPSGDARVGAGALLCPTWFKGSLSVPSIRSNILPPPSGWLSWEPGITPHSHSSPSRTVRLMRW